MSEFTIFVCCLLLLLLVAQLALGSGFAARLLRYRPPAAAEESLPKAGILLPLRGADPELADGLRRLMQQDYPDYELRIVVDSAEDSSWAVVRESMSQIDARHVHVASIQRRRDTCSPQCSALIEAVEALSDDVEVVVIVDGDVVTHPAWLRELVTPLLDPRVGVAHGNRWFMPADAGWGSLVRYVWNAAAIVPMCYLGIPWAGTFAIRKSVLFESGLFDTWPRTVVPDAPSRDLLAKRGLEVRFVPSLMMVNRERCSLAFSLDFLKRQMTWTRVYHSRYWPVLVHAVASTLAPTAALGLVMFGLAAGRVDVAALSGGAFFGYYLGLLAMFALLEFVVRRVVRARGEPTAWLTPLKLFKLLWALPLTLCVHFAAVMLATFRRRVVWRGVVYQINSPLDVQIIGDRPFDELAQPSQTNASL
jgi:cellulose synthase/poly-beta-1,6-N-acetylglucosamine synthase-like glycosyltransferase